MAPGAIVYVGYDTRPGAEHFACLAGRVLAGCGLNAKVCDRPSPTPAVSWTIAHDPRACGGLVVTGSHNPPDYLGIKVRMDDGGTASDDFIELLDLLYQNPSMTMEKMLRSDAFTCAKSEAVSDQTDQNYAEFTI